MDSEHKKNHQNDVWRIYQLNKHLTKEGHVWRKFGSGNKESLTRVGRELKAKGLLNGNGISKSADGMSTSSSQRKYQEALPYLQEMLDVCVKASGHQRETKFDQSTSGV